MPWVRFSRWSQLGPMNVHVVMVENRKYVFTKEDGGCVEMPEIDVLKAIRQDVELEIPWERHLAKTATASAGPWEPPVVEREENDGPRPKTRGRPRKG